MKMDKSSVMRTDDLRNLNDITASHVVAQGFVLLEMKQAGSTEQDIKVGATILGRHAYLMTQGLFGPEHKNKDN